MQKILLLFSLSVLSLFAYDINDDLSVRGFATLDASLTHDENVLSPLTSGTTATLKKDKLNDDYSLAGVQINWNVIDDFDVMIQSVVSKNAVDDKYKASLEWAMLGYNFGDDYRLRLGKMKVPSMEGTENRNINYNFLWARPNVAPKGVNGFDDMYGADLIKKTYIEDVDLEFQLTAGKAQHQLDRDKNHYLYNFSTTASYNDSWLRLSVGQMSFDQVLPTGKTVNKDVILTFSSAETKLSYNSWLFYAGYSTTSNEAIPDTTYLYTSLAYEFDSFTPYLLYTKLDIVNLPVRVLSPPAPPRVIFNGLNTSELNAIGVRYDFYNHFALKAQYNKNKETVKTVNHTYSLTLDMVF